MKRETEKRIKRLESKSNIGNGNRAVFVRYVWPGFIDRPVAGWKFGPWVKEIEVLRTEGENDKDLQSRALALARENIGKDDTPYLTSIDRPDVTYRSGVGTRM
jgi:hypothetical protein